MCFPPSILVNEGLTILETSLPQAWSAIVTARQCDPDFWSNITYINGA